MWISHKHAAVSCCNMWPINFSYVKFAEPVVLVFMVPNAFSHKELAEKGLCGKFSVWSFNLLTSSLQKQLAEKAFVVSFQCGQSLYSQEACKKSLCG